MEPLIYQFLPRIAVRLDWERAECTAKTIEIPNGQHEMLFKEYFHKAFPKATEMEEPHLLEMGSLK